LFGHGGALRAAAAIVPQDGRPNRLIARIQQRQPMHLAGHANRRDIVGGNMLQHGAQADAGGIPPLARVLFRPQRPRGRKIVGVAVAGHNRPALVDHQRFGCGGADVDADKVARHSDVLL
jgi:hypothetical protein